MFLREWNPFTAYKDGLEALYDGNETLDLGIKMGLTTGLMQDWEQQLSSDENLLTKLLDKVDATGVAKYQFNWLINQITLTQLSSAHDGITGALWWTYINNGVLITYLIFVVLY